MNQAPKPTRKPRFFKAVAPYVAAIAVILLAALLVFVIYYTRFTLPWVAFLTGILAAAILSMVSRASRAEWIIARRDAKINALQDRLARETRGRHDLEARLAEYEARAPAAQATPVHVEGIAMVETGIADKAQEMFVQSLSEEVAGPKDAVNRILAAIEQDEFHLLCQRIAPLGGDASADHFEVLIRLREEEEGMMPPGAFFPLVEKYDLMPHLDRWVVRNLIEWIARHPRSAPVRQQSTFFVNLAADSLSDHALQGYILDHLRLNDVPPQALCFEITDNALALRPDEAVLFAANMRTQGCRVALSNFGRDGVLFDPLRELRADFLKIDGSLILNLLRDAADLAQVTAIARVAKTIRIQTVAELVESDPCRERLREIGVDYAQGFGISQPAPIGEIA